MLLQQSKIVTNRLCLTVGCLLLLGVMVVIGSHLIVLAQSSATYNEVRGVPVNNVGLVLGCKRYLSGGYENPFFRNRMEAASQLYKADKINYILVSGDNHRPEYDEASDMKQALIERGIPAAKIVCDYAGFTTLDSIVRAKEVFGQISVTIISQQFHNERAIYIAKSRGIAAVGYNAQDVELKWAFKTYVREIASRVKAVWDVNVSRRQPKFLGEPILIGETIRPT